MIIEVLEKDVIPKGNRKLLNRRNFYKQHLTSLGFSHVRGKYVIQLDDENEIETMKTLLESYRTKYQSYPNSYLRSGDYRKKFFDKNRPIFKDYYICAYCGRFLKKKDVTVDHIISIRKAQKSKNQISVVKPEDTEKLQIIDGKDYVTLVTCTPYGVNDHRLLVRGARTKYEKTQESSIRPRNKDSQWMGTYKRAIAIGLAIVMALVLSGKVYQKLRRKKAEKIRQKEGETK